MEGSSDWFLRTNFFSREKALVTGSVFTSIAYWRNGKIKWTQMWWTFSRNEGKSFRFLRRKPEFSQSFKYATTLNLTFSVPYEIFKLGDTLSCAFKQDIWVRKLTPPYFCRQSLCSSRAVTWPFSSAKCPDLGTALESGRNMFTWRSCFNNRLCV